MHGFGYFQPQIKRGTSNLPLLLKESSRSNSISVDLHDVPASCFSDGGYFNIIGIKNQAQAAPPHGGFSLPHLKRSRQLGSSVTMDYFGHPRYQNLPSSSSPAGSNISSDEHHQYLQLKHNCSLRRNYTKNVYEVKSDASPTLQSGPVKSVVLPLSVSSSASTTKAISHQERKTPCCQHFKTNAVSSRQPETSTLDQNLMMKSRRLQPFRNLMLQHQNRIANHGTKKREQNKKRCTPTNNTSSALQGEHEPAMIRA